MFKTRPKAYAVRESQTTRRSAVSGSSAKEPRRDSDGGGVATTVVSGDLRHVI